MPKQLLCSLLCVTAFITFSFAQTTGSKVSTAELAQKWNCADIESIKKKFKADPKAVKGDLRWQSDLDPTANWQCPVKFPGTVHADVEGMSFSDPSFSRQYYAWEVSEAEAQVIFDALAKKLPACYKLNEDESGDWEKRYDAPDGWSVFLENREWMNDDDQLVYSVAVRINFFEISK